MWTGTFFCTLFIKESTKTQEKQTVDFTADAIFYKQDFKRYVGMSTQELGAWMLLHSATLRVRALWAKGPQQVRCQGQLAVMLLKVSSQLGTHQVGGGQLSPRIAAKILTSVLSGLFVCCVCVYNRCVRHTNMLYSQCSGSFLTVLKLLFLTLEDESQQTYYRQKFEDFVVLWKM